MSLLIDRGAAQIEQPKLVTSSKPMRTISQPGKRRGPFVIEGPQSYEGISMKVRIALSEARTLLYDARKATRIMNIKRVSYKEGIS